MYEIDAIAAALIVGGDVQRIEEDEHRPTGWDGYGSR